MLPIKDERGRSIGCDIQITHRSFGVLLLTIRHQSPISSTPSIFLPIDKARSIAHITNTMDSLLAKQEVTETIYKLAYALDDLDRESMTSLFRLDVPFLFDISASLGIPAKQMTAEEYYEVVLGHLEGSMGRIIF
jgi:hypothetical protein